MMHRMESDAVRLTTLDPDGEVSVAYAFGAIPAERDWRAVEDITCEKGQPDDCDRVGAWYRRSLRHGFPQFVTAVRRIMS